MSSNIYKERKSGTKVDLRHRPLVFIDIETTGLDPLQHEIIEIACLVVNPQTLEIRKEYHRKVQPEHLETADPASLEVNKYSPKAWHEAKSLKEVLKELNSLAPGGQFIGYNVSFDRSFIENAAREYGMMLNFDYHWIDVMSLVYFESLSDKRLERLKLTHVCEIWGIPLKKAHTAMGDVKATLAVYRYLREKQATKKDIFDKEVALCKKLSKKNKGKCAWGKCGSCGVIPLLYKLHKGELLEDPVKISKIKKLMQIKEL